MIKRMFLLFLITCSFNLNLIAQASHSVTLTLTPPTVQAGQITPTGWNFYRYVGNCPANPSLQQFTKLNTTPVPVATPTFVDSSVGAGTTYCYTSSSTTASGESGMSQLVQVVIPLSIASNIPPAPTALNTTSIQ